MSKEQQKCFGGYEAENEICKLCRTRKQCNICTTQFADIEKLKQMQRKILTTNTGVSVVVVYECKKMPVQVLAYNDSRGTVLAYWTTKNEYVTWYFRGKIEDENFDGGHYYYNDFAAALNDYEVRSCPCRA